MARRHRIRLWQRRFDNIATQPGPAVSAAALVLAVALVMSPAGSRARVEALGLLTQARRRLPVLPCAGVDGGVAESLRAVAARARLGADVAAGLHSVARRSLVPAHWGRLAVCWQLAQDHGLAIAALMQTAQRDIFERERFSSMVDVGMTGARTTAAVLAGLPLLGVGLGELVGADPVSFLLSGGFGGWLLVIGVMLACAGLLWSDRITAQALT